MLSVVVYDKTKLLAPSILNRDTYVYEILPPVGLWNCGFNTVYIYIFVRKKNVISPTRRCIIFCAGIFLPLRVVSV